MIKSFSSIITGKTRLYFKAASSAATHSFRDLDHHCVLIESTFSLMAEIRRQSSKPCITVNAKGCHDWAML